MREALATWAATAVPVLRSVSTSGTAGSASRSTGTAGPPPTSRVPHAPAVPVLREAEPAVPNVLTDRAAEAWEPLLAIADFAGGLWPTRARDAALTLHGVSDTESSGVLLLAAIADCFIDPHTGAAIDRLLTRQLLELLAAREGEPWGSWWGQALAKGDVQGPAYKLSKALKPFGITAHSIRVDGERGQGFDWADFVEAWTLIFPPGPTP